VAGSVALPERVTVLTCIGCGAMGRQERCGGSCSEHKLVLVTAADHDALLRVTEAAAARARRLTAVVAPLAEADPPDGRRALLELHERAREALREGGPAPGDDWPAPDTVTGWWCAQCGNVDLPQPCVGVCVWRPAEWVNVARYERDLELANTHLRRVRALRACVARLGAVVPRPGQEQRNWDALQALARAALADYGPR
jgi:hypothetical protein